MLLHETSSSSMSKEDMARMILFHKDLTTKALYDTQLAQERERSYRSTNEALNLDMKNLQKEYARLNDTLLHLQTERVEAKKSEDKALHEVKQAEMSINDLSSKYAEAVLQISQYKEEVSLCILWWSQSLNL
jgi:predicted  nucleic acid-binding Zn-ribbon protein